MPWTLGGLGVPPAMTSIHPCVKHPAIFPKESNLSALLIKHHHERLQYQGRAMSCEPTVFGFLEAVRQSLLMKDRRTKDDKPPTVTHRVYSTIQILWDGLYELIYVKDGRKELKCYALLLTCTCSRAIHIDMLEELTTDAVINTLSSFVILRWSVKKIQCSQGSNFIGARCKFAKAMNEMDGGNLKKFRYEFVINTTSASYQGGFWERQKYNVSNVLVFVLNRSAEKLDKSKNINLWGYGNCE